MAARLRRLIGGVNALVRLRRGRTFSDQDRADGPKPIGKVIALGQGGFDDGAEVIGVVSNVRYRTIEAAPVRTCLSRRRSPIDPS